MRDRPKNEPIKGAENTDMVIRIFLQIIFWLGLFYLAYVEVLYLLLLIGISKIRHHDQPRRNYSPTVTVLIAAHNEEKVIRQRLENILAQGYPRDRLQVIVASDASTDGTERIVQEYENRGVLLCRLYPQGGKVAALRAAEKSITGQVVVFTDADTTFEPGAIQTLVSHFEDPQVGAVTGRETRPDTGKGKGEGLFNRIETLTKRYEGKVGNQVLLHGGIFAMRRELLPYVPDHLTHDAIVPPQLALQDFRTLYEPEAVSVEAYNLDSSHDWRRRIRTVSQSLQSYLYVKDALNPFKSGFYALQIWSHRFMRWFLFPVLVLILLSNLALLGTSAIYQVLAILQGICYLFALIGFLLDRVGRQPALFYFPYYFIYIHLAAFCAVVLTWKGEKVATWNTAVRHVDQVQFNNHGRQ